LSEPAPGPRAIDPGDHSSGDLYRLLISMIVPRPIAWVGSRGADGVDNLAPFSFFRGVGSKPPMIALSVARGSGGALKDTARNLLGSGEFTLSLPMVSEAALVAGSAAPLPAGVSEFAALGIDAVEGLRVAACRPAAAALSLECVVRHALDLDSTHLFVAEVLMFHVAPGLLEDDPRPRVRDGATDPLARLGGADYAALGRRFSQPTPSAAAVLAAFAAAQGEP